MFEKPPIRENNEKKETPDDRLGAFLSGNDIEKFSKEEIESLEDALNLNIGPSHPDLKNKSISLKVKSIKEYPDRRGVFNVNARYMEDGKEVLAGSNYLVKQIKGGWIIMEEHREMIDD